MNTATPVRRFAMFCHVHRAGGTIDFTHLTRPYKITNTPFKRDVCREIADACHKAGMRLGWYYSPTDWWHPASRAGDWDAYSAYMQEHLRELMTEYGTVGFLAYDFWSPVCKHPSWPKFYQESRHLCPHFIHNRNTPWPIGDYECMEHTVPYFRKKSSTVNAGIVIGDYRGRLTCDAPFEVMDCIQAGRWSYEFGKAMPLKSMIFKLVDAAASGGNLNLNVTPDSMGRIPAAQVERLQEIRAWMRTHGETTRLHFTSAGAPCTRHGSTKRLTDSLHGSR